MQDIADGIKLLLDAGHVDAAKKLAGSLGVVKERKLYFDETDKEGLSREFRLYMKEKELSHNTQRNYMDALNDYFGKYNDFSKVNLIEWKQGLIDEYAPKTASSRVIAMNQFVKYILKDEELLLKRVVIPHETNVENVIDIDEYEQLSGYLYNSENFRDYWVVQFLARTGARVGELVRFKKQDLEQGYVQMPTKGKIRVIHIPERLIKDSRFYFKTVDSDYLFPTRSDKTKPITTRWVAEIIKRHGRELGIREEVLHPHSFRHFFAVEFLMRNPDITLLADVMGHASVATTQIYTRMSKEQQRMEINETINW